MPHVSLWARVWGVNMMVPGPIDYFALATGGIIGLYAYNVFALGVFVSGEIGMWDDIGHPTELREEAEVSSMLLFDNVCGLDDPPWWCV